MLKIICLSFLTLSYHGKLTKAQDQKYCNLDACENNSIENQDSVRFWNSNLPELWKWLESLNDIKSLSFCKNKNDLNNFVSDNKPLIGPEECSEKSDVRLRFKTQKTVIAERFEINENESFKNPAKLCYTLLPTIDKITGKFEQGNFHGKGTIFYHDEIKMKVTFQKGIINGLVLIFDKHDDLQVSKIIVKHKIHSLNAELS